VPPKDACSVGGKSLFARAMNRVRPSADFLFYPRFASASREWDCGAKRAAL